MVEAKKVELKDLEHAEFTMLGNEDKAFDHTLGALKDLYTSIESPSGKIIFILALTGLIVGTGSGTLTTEEFYEIKLKLMTAALDSYNLILARRGDHPSKSDPKKN